jgi:hypothetical protein
MRLGNALRISWERQHHRRLRGATCLFVESATVGAVGRQLHSVLIKEVELVKHDERAGGGAGEAAPARSA